MASKAKAPRKIAAFIDAAGNLADPFRHGLVRVYDRSAGNWAQVADIDFSLTGAQGLGALRTRLYGLADELGDCRILLLAEAKGILPALLGERGITVAEASGNSLQLLASLPDRGSETVEENEAETAAPVNADEVGPGAYRIDLAQTLTDRPDLNSKEILFPLLKRAELVSIEVLCDHPPRWLGSEERSLSYIFVVRPRENGVPGFSVMLYRSGEGRDCETAGDCARGCHSRCAGEMTE
jgi:Fe-only nitrogenase accessory protein AnfO